MDVLELLKGSLYILGLVAAAAAVITFFVNAFIPDTFIFFSLGYSMCGERTPHLDFLTLEETDCSIVPGDALLVVRDWPPEIGDVVCVSTNTGIICHRVVRGDGNVFVMEGDAAKWELPFTYESCAGKVVAKIPRIFSMPVIAVQAVLTGSPEALALIDRGSYNPFDRSIKMV